MALNLKGRSFVTLKDYSPHEIQYLLDLAKDLKSKKRVGTLGNLLEDKSIVLIFDKSSTRTRCSFEVAAYDEGAHVTFLTDSHMGKKESTADTAKVLGRLYDGIEYRGFDQSIVDDLAEHAGVPVWNGLTDQYHPTQILADFMTLEEHYSSKVRGLKFVFVGDARNNMGNSYMIGSAKMGVNFVGLAPRSLWPDSGFVNEMKAIAKENGGSIEFSESIDEAVLNADAIATDVWVSMGEADSVWSERIKLLKPYQVDMTMLHKTQNPHVVFMHCLPACHDTNTIVGKKVYEQYGLKSMEVTDEVFQSKHSLVWDEAENRMHTIKAIMVATTGNQN